MSEPEADSDDPIGREEIDLRMLGPAAVSWLVVGLGQLALRTTVWWALAGFVAMALGLGVLLRRTAWSSGVRRRLLVHALAVCLIGVADSGLTAVRVDQRAASPLTVAADRSHAVTVSGTVAAMPRAARAGNGVVVVPVEAETVRAGGRTASLSRPVLIIAQDRQLLALRPGQSATFSGVARPARLPADNDAVLVSARLVSVGDEVVRWRALSGTVRDRLSAVAGAQIGGDTAGLLVALVVGDTSGIGPITIGEFRASGLAHLLAVSGANVAIVVGAALWLLRRCGLPFGAQIAGCGLALAAFVAVTGPEPSVLRAAGMGVVLLIGLAGGRPRASLPALLTAVTVLLWLLPQLATSIGFALSVLATGGIVLLAPPIADRLHLPRWLALPVAVTLSALIATLPLTVILQPRVNGVAVLANLLAAPVVPPITVLGVIAAATAPWLGPGAELACHLAAPLVRWIELVAARSADFGGWQIDWPVGLLGAALVVLAIVVGLLLWRAAARYRLIVPIVAAVLVGVGLLAVPVRYVISEWPPDDWLVASCDVGQGDATLINVGDGQAVLVDAAPDPAAADRCLAAFGVTEVPLLVLTHLHSDHAGGVSAVLGRRPVGGVLITRLDAGAAEHVVRTLASSYGVPVREPTPGELWRAGEVSVVVLGPLRPILGTESDANNNSLVLRVEVGGLSVLIAGDAQEEEQRQMTDVPGIDVDILKVPHHGSSVQHEPFLAATTPIVALISAGLGNSYGHPGSLTLDRLDDLGASTYRTDRQGDIAVLLSDGQIEVVTRPVSNADRGVSG